MNTAVQEFLVQCANEYIPIIAVFIGLVGFFIILLFLAFVSGVCVVCVCVCVVYVCVCV